MACDSFLRPTGCRRRLCGRGEAWVRRCVVGHLDRVVRNKRCLSPIIFVGRHSRLRQNSAPMLTHSVGDRKDVLDTTVLKLNYQAGTRSKCIRLECIGLKAAKDDGRVAHCRVALVLDSEVLRAVCNVRNKGAIGILAQRGDGASSRMRLPLSQVLGADEEVEGSVLRSLRGRASPGQASEVSFQLLAKIARGSQMEDAVKRGHVVGS